MTTTLQQLQREAREEFWKEISSGTHDSPFNYEECIDSLTKKAYLSGLERAKKLIDFRCGNNACGRESHPCENPVLNKARSHVEAAITKELYEAGL